MDKLNNIIVDSPFGPLMLRIEDVLKARSRATDLLPAPSSPPAGDTVPERSQALVDSRLLASMMSLPQTWLEEQARVGRIPSLTLGKYRRFQPDEVLAALTRMGGHTPALTPSVAQKRRTATY